MGDKALRDIVLITSGNSIPSKDRTSKYSSKNNSSGLYFISTKDVGLAGKIENLPTFEFHQKQEVV